MSLWNSTYLIKDNWTACLRFGCVNFNIALFHWSFLLYLFLFLDQIKYLCACVCLCLCVPFSYEYLSSNLNRRTDSDQKLEKIVSLLKLYIKKLMEKSICTFRVEEIDFFILIY